MKILMYIILSTFLLGCEKPAPQKPKVIFSSTKYIQVDNSSNLDTTNNTIDVSLDTLVLDSIRAE